MSKSVMVAMSGGVDSSVAAALLIEQGYEVTGVTMKLWQDDNADRIVEVGCCSLEAVDDARRVCDILGIAHYVMNFSADFKEKVIDYFVNQYVEGYTPNPCIACNRHIKFDLLLNKARSMGMDYIATGHYAQVEYDNSKKRWLLKNSLASAKDQTYALYNLTQEQLEHTLFPLGIYTDKAKIRKIASNLGLRVADKPDSQEICFVEEDYGEYIENSRPGSSKPGNYIDKAGHVIGRHKGIIHYTVGQRKGLGIALGKPAYVVSVNPASKEVLIGENEDIFLDRLIAKDVNLISIEKLDKEIEVIAKIRYSAKKSSANISPLENGKILVRFKDKQRAITPGQSVVFYDGDIVVGGGVIEK